MGTPERLEKISAKIPVSEVARLKELAARNERSIAAEIRLAIRAHLRDGEPVPTSGKDDRGA